MDSSRESSFTVVGFEAGLKDWVNWKNPIWGGGGERFVRGNEERQNRCTTLR